MTESDSLTQTSIDAPKKTTRRLWIKALLVLIGLFAVLFVSAYWQLSSGPVSLSWLEPRIGRELSATFAPLTVEVTGVNLRWRKPKRLLELRVGTLEVHDPDARRLLVLSDGVMALSFGRGLRTTLAPLYVEIQGARVSLIRNQQGGFMVTLPTRSGQPKTEPLAVQLEQLLSKGGTLSQLTHIALNNVEFSVTDERWNTHWGSQGSHFHLTNDQRSLRAEATVQPLSGHPSPPLQLEAQWDLSRNQLTGRVVLDEGLPSAFLPPPANDSWLSCLTNQASLKLKVEPVPDSNSHSVSLLLDTPSAELTGSADLDLVTWRVVGELNLARLQLWQFAPLHGHLDFLSGAHLTMQGKASYQLGKRLTTTATAELKTTQGQPHSSDLYPDGPLIDQIELEILMEGGLEQIELKTLNIVSGEEHLSVQAKGGQVQDGFAADVTASLNGISMERLVDLWPATTAPKPRQWISQHLRSGQAKNIRASLSLGARPGTKRPFDVLGLAGSFDFSQLELDVLPPLEPIIGIDGNAQFTLENGFQFQVNAGSNAELRITHGQVTIADLDTRSPMLRVDTVWQSPTSRIIEVITSEPLTLVDRTLLQAEDFSGQAEGTFGFSLNLNAESEPHDLTLDAYAEQFRWRNAPLDLDLTGERIRSILRDDSLTISGPVSANGVPTQSRYVEFLNKSHGVTRNIQVTAQIDDADRQALNFPAQPILGGAAGVTLDIEMDRRGNVDLRAALDLTPSRLDLTPLGWVKPPSETGEAAITAHRSPAGIWSVSLDQLKAKDLTAQAQLKFRLNPSILYHVDPLALTLSTNDLALSLNRETNGRYALHLSGKHLDTQPLFAFLTGRSPTNLWQTSGGHSSGLPDLTLDISYEQLSVGRDPGITNFTATATYRDSHWDTVQIVGAPSPGQDLIISYTPTDSGHTLRANADRAADLLAAALQHGDFEGGDLTIRATKAGPDQPLTGRLLINDYLMKQAPVMGRLLKMSSMHGLFTTLTSKGIEVTRYESDFSYQDLRLEIHDAKLHGDLGLSGSGYIDFGKSTLNITGALAPMPALQRAAGKIPLIGNLLAGRDSAGVFAALYRIHGPLNDPIIYSRPVSIFTPGITRGLFDMERDSKSEQPPSAGATQAQ